jgi:DNA-binding response OmpR family regulator
MGGETHVAYEGLTALDAFRDFQASVVLLDLGMPGMDGYETCRRIRRQFGKGVGVIALTGWGQESDRRLTREAGFDAHLTKPAEPAKLEEVIRTLAVAVR